MARTRQAGLKRISKDQVTIPPETTGLLPNTEVRHEPGGQRLLDRMQGKATSGMSTEDIMELTRGEN